MRLYACYANKQLIYTIASGPGEAEALALEALRAREPSAYRNLINYCEEIKLLAVEESATETPLLISKKANA